MVRAQLSAQDKQEILIDCCRQNLEVHAVEILRTMDPIDVVLVQYQYPEFKDLGYWIACSNQWLMFETAYLWSVTGQPPYIGAQEFSLTPDEIANYQAQWRSAGVEPTDIKEQQQQEFS